MASNYLEFQFKIHPPVPASEILIAELGSLGFESFVENEDGVTAYILKEEFNENMLTEVRILDSDEFRDLGQSSDHAKVRDEMKELLLKRLMNRKNRVAATDEFVLEERDYSKEDDIMIGVW